jgi:hypothetical protein
VQACTLRCLDSLWEEKRLRRHVAGVHRHALTEMACIAWGELHYRCQLLKESACYDSSTSTSDAAPF